MFQLIEPTLVRLKHINLRQETHGKQKVSAVDLDFAIEGHASRLSLLHDKLPAAFYYDPAAEAGQETLESVPTEPQKQRFPRIGVVPWSVEGSGMDLAVDYGLGDEESNIEFADGKAGTKRFELKAEGVVAIFWRYSTSSIPDGAIDKLREKLDQFIEITLVQNERLRDDAVQQSGAIDGTQAAFEKDHPSATDMFAADAGDPEGADSEGGEVDVEADGDDEGAPRDLEDRLDDALAKGDDVPSTTRNPPGSRTARGRERMKRALAEGAAS